MSISRQAETLNNYFRENHMKQTDIAERLGINPSNLSCMLNGKRTIGASMAMKMHEEFGFDYHFLMTGEGELFAPKGRPVNITQQKVNVGGDNILNSETGGDKESKLLDMCRDLLDQVMQLRIENCDLRAKIDKMKSEEPKNDD